MSRIWIRGSSMGVRIFAVGVLVTGIGVGGTAGYLDKTGDTQTLKEVSQQHAAVEFASPPLAEAAAALPAGAAASKLRSQLVAEVKAKAAAAAKAEAARKAAKLQAERAAAERASRSKKRKATGGGELPPQTPVDCMTFTGHRRTGCSLLGWAGFGTNQMNCLERLWTKESRWTPTSHNGPPSTGAHGIPQARPGSKMKSYGADWATNAVVQIKWGLMYIKGRYGTPCGAWGHFMANNWY